MGRVKPHCNGRLVPSIIGLKLFRVIFLALMVSGQSNPTKVTLYGVFLPGETSSLETRTTIADPKVTIGPEDIGSDGKTRYLYDVAEPSATYAETMIADANRFTYSVIPPSSLFLRNAGSYESCSNDSDDDDDFVDVELEEFDFVTVPRPTRTSTSSPNCTSKAVNSSSSSRSHTGLIVGIVVAVTTVTVAIVLACFVFSRRKLRAPKESQGYLQLNMATKDQYLYDPVPGSAPGPDLPPQKMSDDYAPPYHHDARPQMPIRLPAPPVPNSSYPSGSFLNSSSARHSYASQVSPSTASPGDGHEQITFAGKLTRLTWSSSVHSLPPAPVHSSDSPPLKPLPPPPMLSRAEAGGRTAPVAASHNCNAGRPSMEFNQHPGTNDVKSYPELEFPSPVDSSSASGYATASTFNAGTAYPSDTKTPPIDHSRPSSSYNRNSYASTAHTLSLPAGPGDSRRNTVTPGTEASISRSYTTSSAASDVTGTNVPSHDTFGNTKSGRQGVGTVGADAGFGRFQILNWHDGDEEPAPPAYSL